MNEIEKMRSGLLADFSAPEVQDSFRHCKKLLAKFRTMSTYDDDYRTVLEDLIRVFLKHLSLCLLSIATMGMEYGWANMYL